MSPTAQVMTEEADITESDVPIIKLVSLVICEAHRNRASDIHLSPWNGASAFVTGLTACCTRWKALPSACSPPL